MFLERTDEIPSQLLNEIMPMIYKRFTEKAAEEWRQIYKVSRTADYIKSRLRLTTVGSPTARISHQERLRARHR